MARPMKRVPDKDIRKDLTGDVPIKKKADSRYVASRNIDAMKKKGWKVVGDGKDAKGKIEGVRVHSKDLILMSK